MVKITSIYLFAHIHALSTTTFTYKYFFRSQKAEKTEPPKRWRGQNKRHTKSQTHLMTVTAYTIHYTVYGTQYLPTPSQ